MRDGTAVKVARGIGQRRFTPRGRRNLAERDRARCPPTHIPSHAHIGIETTGKRHGQRPEPIAPDDRSPVDQPTPAQDEPTHRSALTGRGSELEPRDAAQPKSFPAISPDSLSSHRMATGRCRVAPAPAGDVRQAGRTSATAPFRNDEQGGCKVANISGRQLNRI